MSHTGRERVTHEKVSSTLIHSKPELSWCKILISKEWKNKNTSFFPVNAFCFSSYTNLFHCYTPSTNTNALHKDFIRGTDLTLPDSRISNPLQEVYSNTFMRLVSAELTSPSSSRITPLSAKATHPAENYFFYDSVHGDRRSTDSYISNSVTFLLPHALLLLSLLQATRTRAKPRVPAASILQRSTM